MARTKETARAAKVESNSSKGKKLSSVKDARVTKPALSGKVKAKDTAKAAVDKAKGKKGKKDPEPVSESEDASEEDSEDDASSGSSDSSDDEAEEKAPPALNGKAKKIEENDSSDDSENDDDDDDESSDDDKDAKVKKSVNADASSDVSDGASSASESETDDSGSDESDAEAKPVKAKTNGTSLSNEKATKKADNEDEDSSVSGSDSSEDEEEEEAPKKRKADSAAEPAGKKAKTEAAPASDGPRNLFVGNLSWNVEEDMLYQAFEEFGEITGCRIITDRNTGRKKGFGYVEFASHDSAKRALDTMHNTDLDGRPLNLDFSNPRPENPNANDFKQKRDDRANRYGDKPNTPSDTLFLGNLSFDVTSDIVREEFEKFGTITRVSLPTDMESGAPKGFGYVGYESVDQATSAFEGMSGFFLAGRPIRVDYAAPRADNGGGRGGRGGGRGGRGDFGGRGGRGGRGGGRGGRGDRGGGRGGYSTNRGGFGDFKGNRVTF